MNNPFTSKLSPNKINKGSEKFSDFNPSNYTKPRWMLNESITDNKWIIAKTGFDLNNNIQTITLYFEKEISSGELLTDNLNSSLLIDIKNSLLYLSLTENITRALRFHSVLNSTINLIIHTNELRSLQRKKPIRNLSMITFEDFKNYLTCFDVNKNTFSSALDIIQKKSIIPEEIDWTNLKKELKITSREYSSLQHRLKKYINSIINESNKASHYKSEFPNANNSKFDIDIDLAPSEKTISNEISKLQCLWIARPTQKYKFIHDISKLFSDGSVLFNQLIQSEKTRIIPANVAFFCLSKALFFLRSYGPSLHNLIKDLHILEKNSIKELSSTKLKITKSTRKVRKHAFKKLKIPPQLKDLNITSWETEETFERIKHSHFRNQLSVGGAILLYVASMWIVLASFTANRRLSLLNLKRNCFQQSPIDGLFDIVARIPKSSEIFELEDSYRPIPDLVFDYGIEFASFVSTIEERRGLYFNEDEVFLFGKILNLQSYSAFAEVNCNDYGIPILKQPLGGQTIYKSLCFFQDWTESPLIDGERWYPSNHQFRRLFAVLYFSFSDQKGLEELSWFLGHSSLEQTFHYAETNPTDEWIEEAEATIARIGSSLNSFINADDDLTNIIQNARASSSIELVLEPLIRKMIDDHKLKTNQEVRFTKIDNKDIFFFFVAQEKIK